MGESALFAAYTGPRQVIRRLVSPADEMIDLDEATRAAALDDSHNSWQADQGRLRDRNTPPDVPGGVYLRERRLATLGG